MIVWNNKLYFGEGIKRKHRKMIRAINKRKLTPMVYVIAFASNPTNLFDIYKSQELLFPIYKKMEVHIVGLAKGKEEATVLVMDMLLEVYHKTGDFKVREYFTNL